MYLWYAPAVNVGLPSLCLASVRCWFAAFRAHTALALVPGGFASSGGPSRVSVVTGFVLEVLCWSGLLLDRLRFVRLVVSGRLYALGLCHKFPGCLCGRSGVKLPGCSLDRLRFVRLAVSGGLYAGWLLLRGLRVLPPLWRALNWACGCGSRRSGAAAHVVTCAAV